jgi:geranylgeranyl diphosphate synthase type I
MLSEARRIALDALRETSLRDYADLFDSRVVGGKMLRARLLLAVGPAAGVPRPVLCRAGAGIEMLHAASLLHDDVVDGGALRRGEPATWITRGARAAVLLGDLLVSLAVENIRESLPERLPMLIATLREMCDAEAEQEFSGASRDASWERCVSIASRKTGSLFGFAAACAGDSRPALVGALQRAGRALGTAYQLADDLLDASPLQCAAGKSLGTDAATGKLTAATALRGGADSRAAIASLLVESEDLLQRWPAVQLEWLGYIKEFIAPLIGQYTGRAVMEVAS